MAGEEGASGDVSGPLLALPNFSAAFKKDQSDDGYISYLLLKSNDARSRLGFDLLQGRRRVAFQIQCCCRFEMATRMCNAHVKSFAAEGGGTNALLAGQLLLKKRLNYTINGQRRKAGTMPDSWLIKQGKRIEMLIIFGQPNYYVLQRSLGSQRSKEDRHFFWTIWKRQVQNDKHCAEVIWHLLLPKEAPQNYCGKMNDADE